MGGRTASIRFRAITTSVQKYVPDNVLRSVKEQLLDTADKVIKAYDPYPPERTGQKYKRRYAPEGIAGQWEEEFHWGLGDRGLTLTITNRATDYRPGRVYSGYVMGGADTHQAWMHVGIWPDIVEVAKDLRRDNTKAIREIYKKYAYSTRRQ